MPQVISREQALAEIEKQMPAGNCLICHLIEHRQNYIIHKNQYCTVLLSLYPRTWGQVMVLLNEHKTNFSDVDPGVWLDLSTLLFRATRAVESVLKPLRCYVASTGSTSPMTSPHLHFNILPVYNESDKPSSIFTWENGLLSGTGQEWEDLFEKLKAEFANGVSGGSAAP
jgi:diadenosine tetraphosphate (Ap4A) HIT family hydrolase